jgi:hypothetical protein
MQPYCATSRFERVTKRLFVFELLFGSAEVAHVSDFRGGTEGELSRKQSLQVRGLGDDRFWY